jgi:hypothetical protein
MLHLFGTPRFGDVAFFADWQNSPLTHNTWIWLNAGDPVPHLPARTQGYCHVEKQWLLYPDGAEDYGDIDEAGAAPAFRFTRAALLRMLAGRFRPHDLRTHALDGYLARFAALA